MLCGYNINCGYRLEFMKCFVSIMLGTVDKKLLDFLTDFVC